jgi:hypothetical protein
MIGASSDSNPRLRIATGINSYELYISYQLSSRTAAYFDFKSHIRYATRVGRKKRWNEDMVARFPEGTFGRIINVLEKNEDRTDFVRSAVARELKRREARGRKAQSAGDRRQ